MFGCEFKTEDVIDEVKIEDLSASIGEVAASAHGTSQHFVMPRGLIAFAKDLCSCIEGPHDRSSRSRVDPVSRRHSLSQSASNGSHVGFRHNGTMGPGTNSVHKLT